MNISTTNPVFCGILVVFSALCLVAASEASTESSTHSGVQAAIEEDPLAIVFSYNGSPLTALRADGRSAFYLVDGETRIDLVDPPVDRFDDAVTALVFHTVDGRTVAMTVAPAEEGAVQVRFAVDEKGEFEKLGVAFRVGASEGFYGLMERVVQGSQGFSWEPGVTQGFNLRGQIVDLYTLPTVSLYSPFFVSSAGYGVYVESDWPGTYRFGVDAQRKTTPAELTIEYEGPELAFRIIPGPTPLEVIERYARTVGTTLVPPQFAFGPYRWRDVLWDLPVFYDGTPYDGPYNSMVVEDVLMMEALGIPCAWYPIDRPWAVGSFGYGAMEVDEARLPQFREMIQWLASKGIKTILWIAPWVMDALRDEAIAKGYHVANSIPYLPQAVLVDFTNPEAVVWWQKTLTEYIDAGIAGFKLDRGEEKTPDGQLFRGTYHGGTSYREGHNVYPVWFAKAAHDAFEKAGVDEHVSLIRAGWIGTSQYAIVWGGDTAPTEWGLRSAIIALQRAAVLNVPMWGSDTGGYNKRPPREVLARWLAFSAFCPLMEVGPLANLAPWSWLPDGAEDEIGEGGYTFDTIYDGQLIATWILYANLHNDLVKYTYEQARMAHERGTPIVRPMILAYPNHPEYLDLFEQYLYGPDLLVRPVWRTGTSQVDVHIPEGTWIDAWTNQETTGPTVVTVDAPEHVIPIFVRKGSTVPLGDLNARWEKAIARAKQTPNLLELAQTVR